MKIKNLLFLIFTFLSNMFFSQFTSGVVNLPNASMTVKLDVNASNVTFTLTGDSSSMLAIGFGNSGMDTGDDGFIYNSTANRDYTFNGLGNAPTADSSQDWTISSNSVSGSTRTVVATRSLTGGSGDFVFNNSAGAIIIYYARRSGSLTIGNHGSSLRGYATLNMTANLSVDDVEQRNRIGIYPNPTKEVLNFKNYSKIKEVSVYDVNGKVILLPQKVKEKINISKFTSGVYFVEITLEDGTKLYEKIIKN